MPIPEFNDEIIQTERNRIELGRWVDSTLDQFTSSAEGRQAFRLNQGNRVKQFSEEVVPLRLYADATRNDCYYKLVLGNQSYDALILNDDRQAISHLQITQAFDGYQTYLRMLHLNQYGHAPLSGEPLERSEDGLLNESPCDFEHRDSRIESELLRVHQAVERKATMRYESNTELIVHFHSSGIIDEEYMERLNSYIKENTLILARNFTMLHLISGVVGCNLNYEIVAS